ncbi:MAG: NUDIX domain-containing protein [Candidatus Liptonbacteria bacterium]|nr:NUDIX domain-containing protein [Candidatus Liptonbacteria bacterium]
MRRVIIVDSDDIVIGYKEGNELAPTDTYRVSALWITDRSGNILLARRALTKEHDPGKWGPAVAGTVEEGETYASNVIKEAEEELGLTNIKPAEGPKEKFSGEYKFFGQWYLLTLDGQNDDFVINREEVEEIKWFSKAELRKAIEEKPDDFLQSMGHLEKLLVPQDFGKMDPRNLLPKQS